MPDAFAISQNQDHLAQRRRGAEKNKYQYKNKIFLTQRRKDAKGILVLILTFSAPLRLCENIVFIGFPVATNGI